MHLPIVDMCCGLQFENKHFIEEAIVKVNNCSSRIGFLLHFLV